jgi:hypothetical protein
LRTCLLLEELAEWLSAHARRDLVATADAWADRTWVLFGDAAGLPAARANRLIDAIPRVLKIALR